MFSKGSAAYWFCVGSTGEFKTFEPDRSECKHKWVEDVDEKVTPVLYFVKTFIIHL